MDDNPKVNRYSGFSLPESATLFKAPFSQRFIDQLRKEAERLPYPRNVLQEIQSEILQADRTAHESAIRQDQAGLNHAILERCRWTATLGKAKGIITDEFLAMAAIAVETNPDAVLRILNVNKLQGERLNECRDAIVALRARVDQAEAALREVAGVIH